MPLPQYDTLTATEAAPPAAQGRATSLTPHTLTQQSWTPLMHVAKSGHEALARLLLRHGAVVDVEDRYRVTPLIQAAKLGSLPVVTLLTVYGAAVPGATQKVCVGCVAAPLAASGWLAHTLSCLDPSM